MCDHRLTAMQSALDLRDVALLKSLRTVVLLAAALYWTLPVKSYWQSLSTLIETLSSTFSTNCLSGWKLSTVPESAVLNLHHGPLRSEMTVFALLNALTSAQYVNCMLFFPEKNCRGLVYSSRSAVCTARIFSWRVLSDRSIVPHSKLCHCRSTEIADSCFGSCAEMWRTTRHRHLS